MLSTVAVGVCFALAATFLNNFSVYAQSTVVTTNTESLLAQLNGTIIAISGLMAVGISIVTGVIAWLRAKTGDKIVSDGANEWLQALFEQIRQKDGDIRDVFRQVLEKHAQLDVVLDVIKTTNPEVKKRIEEAQPEIQARLTEINKQITNWQNQADKIYSVMPANDPVGK